MAMDKQKTLVTRMLARSVAGDLDWKEAVQSNAFDVSFKDNSVRIKEIARGEGESPDYEVSLINDEGRIVDQFLDTELDADTGRVEWFRKMKDLHEIARRTALGSEAILNEILGELDDDHSV